MSTTHEQRVDVLDSLPDLDTITASLVARQSRSDDGSLSIPDQVAAMREWCAKQSPPIIVGNVYEESDVSGRKPLAKRKGLLRAVEDVEAGRAQMILTAYYDRFVRSVQTRADVLIRVEDNCGGTVMTIDFGKTSNATPVSKFTGTILAAVAEYVAEQAGEKTHVTKQRNIDRGVAPFPRITPAYVRNDDGTLRQHETYGPLVESACRMRASGKSYLTIQRALAASGLDLTTSGVESMLTSRLLIGEIHFGKFKPNLHAIANPVIDRATFRKMQSMRVTRGRYAKSERLLARQDVLHCETCDARLSVHSSSTSGKLYAYYTCGNRLCTKPATVACDVADEHVRDEAIKLTGTLVGRASHHDDLNRARAERERIAERRDAAIRTLLGLDESVATREVLDTLQAEYDAAVEREHRLTTLSTPACSLTSRAAWDVATLDEKRALVTAVVARAVVSPGRGPDRVRVIGRVVQ